MLPPEAVIDIAKILAGDERAFVVGGQAINLWAEYYSAATDELETYRPFTSKDIDYFGQRNVAQKLADGLGGTISVPGMDDTTFQTAVVNATLRGIQVDIDFLSHVLGVRRGLEDGVVDLVIPYSIDGQKGEIPVRLMHPLHCLQSRIANIVTLERRDDTARRQANTAPIVLREFISEALADGDTRAATDTFRALFAFLKTDTHGRVAHKYLHLDPIEIFRRFVDDPRLDERYRQLTLRRMIEQLERMRRPLLRVLDKIDFSGSELPEDSSSQASD